MLLQIENVLNEAQLRSVRSMLSESAFADGAATAGYVAATVKQNEEIRLGTEQLRRLHSQLRDGLLDNTVFQAAVMPYKMTNPIFARYRPSMTYGDHVDNAVMGTTTRIRADVAMTLFLQPASSYEGGELMIRTVFGEQAVKLGAGDVVVYPSSSLHRVAPVTSGERLVCLGWIQSYVREPERRELLYELFLARESLMAQNQQSEAAIYVNRSYVNLMRMWSEV